MKGESNHLLTTSKFLRFPEASVAVNLATALIPTNLFYNNGSIVMKTTVTPQRATKVRWKIFAIIFILVVINLIDRVSLSIGMPVIAEELSLSPVMQGIILSSFFWSYALLQIPGGWLTDKLGPHKMITGSTLFWGGFQALAAVATGGISLLLTRLALGAAESPLFPAAAKLNSIWLSFHERGRGAVITDCGGPLGAAVGGLIIAHMIAQLGSWRLVFAIAGGVTILLSWVAWRYLHDDPRKHPGVNTAELTHINAPSPQDDTVEETDPEGRVYRFGASGRLLTPILCGRACWAMIYFGLLTWGPNYLSHAKGLDLISIGNATFFIFMSAMAGSLSGGFLMDYFVKSGFNQQRILKFLLTFSGTCTLVAFLTLQSITSAMAAVVVLSIAAFFLMWGSLYWSIPPLLVTKSKVGIVGGVMNMAGSTGGICVPIIVGLLLQTTGNYDFVLYFFAFCAVGYTLGNVFISLKDKNRGVVCITVQ
ncbi:MFS transporter [Enterobacteriaceae bacterium H11S18]|uniref:MFS transporter n=1 Tax=Dryocola clanedunensis TaxID=2925396 RepID=UPI0022F141C2|nr:MFS transporter [Dryocola clanedunensis]MCT4709085.1 MFS transporter [Dryocola clanedunensis]